MKYELVIYLKTAKALGLKVLLDHLVGAGEHACTGRSAGFSPLRIRST
jgi:hypothetical protein